MEENNRNESKIELIEQLISCPDYVIFYDTTRIMNAKQLLENIFEKRLKLLGIGFSEEEVFKIIFQTDSLNLHLIRNDLFEMIIEYYKINVP